MDSVLDRRRLQDALEEDMFVGTRRTSTRTGATLLALFSLYFFVSSTTVDTTTVQPTRTSGSQRCPSFAPGNAATSTKRQPFVCNYTFFLHMPFSSLLLCPLLFFEIDMQWTAIICTSFCSPGAKGHSIQRWDDSQWLPLRWLKPLFFDPNGTGDDFLFSLFPQHALFSLSQSHLSISTSLKSFVLSKVVIDFCFALPKMPSIRLLHALCAHDSQWTSWFVQLNFQSFYPLKDVL